MKSDYNHGIVGLFEGVSETISMSKDIFRVSSHPVTQ